MDYHERLPPEVAELFPDGDAGRTLSVMVPSGYVVWPDPGYPQHQPAKQPAFWISDDPVPCALWSRLRAEHHASGLWPIMLEDTTQPWSMGQIAPEPVEEIGTYDAAAFMAEIWAEWEEPAADVTPFGRYSPGLAPPGELQEDPDALAGRCAEVLGERSLGLVPVTRGADTLTVMGWQGARHHNPWTAPLSAVVRSWEDRFGARLIGVGFNTLELSVAAPPTTFRHALHVAAEHWTFCPEVILQGAGTLEGHAEQICGSNIWSFWWE
ncbi:DUF4253 domain-containing protein [Actinoallomurus sp. NPDC050550]|uniref:DUF4253 domain-containing protein n=1 Tax=Actinoallomurus sp. NPDC050550 TaxID=3154937 RepID=UPI0033C4BD89